jgi:YgiT-type zinc finger domain-containing protein
MCKHGELLSGKSIFARDIGGAVFIIKSVPALVCVTCEEEYLDEFTIEQLENQVVAMNKSGMRVGIVKFAM